MKFYKNENDILFLSIKPEFAEKIFEGSKRVELRKSRPKVQIGDCVIIYVTNPVKAVRGVFRVKGLIESKPEDLWISHREILGIDLKSFKDYYQGSVLSIGIEIEEVIEFKKEVSLETIRKFIPKFTPPQTYRYFAPSLVSHFL
jgi:predicted transcriptional regulator